MAVQRPGFGPKKEPWIGFVGAVGLLLIALWSFRTQSGYWFLLWASFGALSLWSALSERREQQAEVHALRYAAPVPQAQLTHIAMSGLGGQPDDLAANRQGMLTQRQLAKLQSVIPRQFKHTDMSPVRWVEGVVKLTPRGGKRPASVNVGRVSIPVLNTTYLNAFKRGVPYRVYYVEVTYRYGWASGRYNTLVAAEALSDG